MSQTITLPNRQSSTLSRVLIFAYGVTCYALGVSGLVWLILVTLGIVPFAVGPIEIATPAAAIGFNIALVALFGIQHAIMARPWFKERWTKIIPASAERSTFTLLAGLLMANMMFLWQPLGAEIWTVQNETVQLAMRGLCAFGWVYMLTATFAIDHFELFGLKQVYRQLRGDSTPAPAFQQRLMYHFDRHPLMTGVLIAIWSQPVMRLDNLVLALGLTFYIGLGVAIEERDLVRLHGDSYRNYRNKTRTIVPLMGNRG